MRTSPPRPPPPSLLPSCSPAAYLPHRQADGAEILLYGKRSVTSSLCSCRASGHVYRTGLCALCNLSPVLSFIPSFHVSMGWEQYRIKLNNMSLIQPPKQPEDTQLDFKRPGGHHLHHKQRCPPCIKAVLSALGEAYLPAAPSSGLQSRVMGPVSIRHKDC